MTFVYTPKRSVPPTSYTPKHIFSLNFSKKAYLYHSFLYICSIYCINHNLLINII